MTGKELKEKEVSLLELVGGALKENGTDVEFSRDEAGNDILIADFEPVSDRTDEMIGAFYFLPPAEDEVLMHHFQTAFTVMDDVPQDAGPMLLGMLTRLNYCIPYGRFLLSPDGEMLTFRNEQGIPLLLDEETQEAMTLYYIGIAQEICRVWTDPLLGLISGEVTPAEFEKDMKV